MSQRCLISFRKNVEDSDSSYDCIYDENGSFDVLLKDWLAYSNGSYLGPWKLNIRDKELFPQFLNDFNKIEKYIPELKSLEDIWMIRIDGVSVWNNPSLTYQFEEIVKNIKDQGIENDY